MNRVFCAFALIFMPALVAVAQQSPNQAVKDTTAVVDSMYREDQFYFGVTYNLLTAAPDQVKLRGFSGGMRVGFIRDMPINAKRNIAVGVGLGLGFNRFGNTLAINQTNGETSYSVLSEDITFDSNRFSTAHVEVPLEFRWRSSTAESYKFYRLYGGLTVSYHYWDRATFVQDGTRFKTNGVSGFNPIQMEASLLFGYNTINFYAAYTLTPFFDGTTGETQQEVGFQPLKLGILFYFL